MKTLAIIIGNDDYYKGYELGNAVNDATGIKDVFEKLGYDIIFLENGKSNDIVNVLTEFENRIKDYDATIFFFAGHGFEQDGENYLAFTECQIGDANSYHCKQTCIQLSDLLKIYSKNTNKINIVILDACRRGFERGQIMATSPFQAPKGTFIAFSTSPNDGASDHGYEGNSIFTGSLLKYIGRERLSVEELFKKVRKTVFALSNGKKTTWEYTSLIGDFFFNTGQLVYSLALPYSEDVVKDINYSKHDDQFSNLIFELKSYDWNRQNPAIISLLEIPKETLNKNQQFLLGRNLLQASDRANKAKEFMKDLYNTLIKYTYPNGDNHVLNGILFEIYFDPHGEFRKDRTKKHFFDTIIELRKKEMFKNSFEFINNLLLNSDYRLLYIPKSQDEIMDIDIVANNKNVKDFLDTDTEYQIISKISFNANDITNKIASYDTHGLNELGLKQVLANFLTCPISLININSNIILKRIAIAKSLEEKDLIKW